MNPIVEVNVQSEIGKLNGVIIHTPGEEVENMTPENAERALYSDIINLSIARKEYDRGTNRGIDQSSSDFFYDILKAMFQAQWIGSQAFYDDGRRLYTDIPSHGSDDRNKHRCNRK